VAMLMAAFLMFALLSVPQAGEAQGSNSRQLASSLQSVVNGHKLGSRANFGVVVSDLESGRSIFSHQSDTPLIPASNMKVLTTAAAIDLLGSDFTIKTVLRYRGSIQDGVLEGDLLLIGRGDPNISGRHFDGDVTSILRDMVI